MTALKFTYPFCYTPHPKIKEASERIIRHIDETPELKDIFAEGKMLGILMVESSTGYTDFLFGFSGLAGGRSQIDGFVPPIFDLQVPDGHFKLTEARISALTARIRSLESGSNSAAEDEGGEELIKELKAERKQMSNDLQEWIFRQFVVFNALGERKTILDIFAAKGLVPPGGTGECAAPKLLQYAYANGLKPLAMGEFWYGASPEKEIRHQGCFYPSCTGKCGPLLSYMLQGLEVEPNPLDNDKVNDDGDFRIIYEDESVIVVDKPSGMLAVPGKTLKVSLQERLQKQAGEGVQICSCHRLDMDTSGLMVFAKGPENQTIVQQQFEHREVVKTYVARLAAPDSEAKPLPASGRISLPLVLDYYDRPRQMVSFEDGKQAVTDWELVKEFPDGEVEVRFTPLTGRTHQLRVHSAHKLGLGRPIKGDRLYGGGSEGRLCLHADTLQFSHPLDGRRLKFKSEPDFI